jgi:hypothetical protein
MSAQHRLALLALLAAAGCSGEMTFDGAEEADADPGKADDPGGDQDPGTELTIDVPGGGGWVDTGIELEQETIVQVLASGTIAFDDAMTETGPDGFAPDDHDEFNLVQCADHASLVGRIRSDGEPELLGDDATTAATDAGRLYLGVNDSDLGNNSGAFAVRVSTRAPSSVLGRTSVTVPATETWTDTGIDLSGGELVVITASGAVDDNVNDVATSWGPGGVPGSPDHGASVLACANHASLIAKVDETGGMFPVGASYSGPARLAGRLFLGINDGVTTDNGGELAISITLLER